MLHEKLYTTAISNNSPGAQSSAQSLSFQDIKFIHSIGEQAGSINKHYDKKSSGERIINRMSSSIFKCHYFKTTRKRVTASSNRAMRGLKTAKTKEFAYIGLVEIRVLTKGNGALGNEPVRSRHDISFFP